MTYGVVDLFCGVGGLTCGLETAGLDVVAGYDLDSSCEYTYTHNNNAIFINRNVEEVTGKKLKNYLEDMMLKYLLDVHHVSHFLGIRKIKKIEKSIKTGSYCISLGD